jgi:hypothetical protein
MALKARVRVAAHVKAWFSMVFRDFSTASSESFSSVGAVASTRGSLFSSASFDSFIQIMSIRVSWMNAARSRRIPGSSAQTTSIPCEAMKAAY